MKKTSKKNLVLTVLLFVLVILVSVVVFMALSLLGKFNQVNNSMNATKNSGNDASTLTAETLGTNDGESFDLNSIDMNVLKDKDVTNILLIGQDRRSGETGRTRSDTMIICSINAKTNQISLTSLMRDMYVPIPGYDANRINSAYVFGGMELLDSLITQDFGVSIDGNIEVDFDGFLTALAEVGPLVINLSEEEAEYMTNFPLDGTITGEQPWQFEAGDNLLYSGALLQYARMRHVGNSDWDRTERQKTVIKLAFAKIKDMNIFSLLNLASKLLPTITTDLSTKECLSYVYAVMSKGMTINENNFRLPIDDGYESRSINGMSVLVPDLQANAEALQKYIYGKVLNNAIASYTAEELSDDTMGTKLNETASSSEREEYGWEDPNLIMATTTPVPEYTADSTYYEETPQEPYDPNLVPSNETDNTVTVPTVTPDPENTYVDPSVIVPETGYTEIEPGTP